MLWNAFGRRVQCDPLDPRLHRVLYVLALAAGVAPIWAAGPLPLVDLPQHLHLISVLHRLDDPTTLFPSLFEARGQLTPYLGYYHVVSLLNWLLPLELANKVFLTAYVAGMPLGLAFLLRALGRPTWASLLALPFAYGDSLAWGFVNYCSALPLSFLCMGLFVRAIQAERWAWAHGAGLALCLLSVLLFHVQAFAYLGLALPWLLLTTSAPKDDGAGWKSRLLARKWALAGVVPGVVAFLLWIGLRLGEPTEVQVGAPWKAWGPLLSPQNLSYKSFAQNRSELFEVVANMLRDRSDRLGFYAVLAVAALATLLALSPWGRAEQRGGPWERWRLPGLAAIALALYFTLPFDIRGYMYYLSTRFAHLAWPLMLAAVPMPKASWERLLIPSSLIAALFLGVPLARGFSEFSKEAAGLETLVAQTAEKPMIMGLIFDSASRVVIHPVYLHAATVLARERGGATNFSFALTPHSPLKFRGTPPPTFPSEWRPQQFDYATMGRAYDHFLVRGVHPARVFGRLLDSELAIAAEASGFFLVRRR